MTKQLLAKEYDLKIKKEKKHYSACTILINHDFQKSNISNHELVYLQYSFLKNPLSGKIL